jgi:hypothetical protein
MFSTNLQLAMPAGYGHIRYPARRNANRMHPYSELEWTRLRFWSVLLLCTWALLTPILIWAAPGRSDFTIPELAVAGSAAAAAEILSHWQPSDRLAFSFILGFDFLYDLVHNNAVAFSVAWAAAHRSSRWIAAGSVLAWLLWFATAANIVENLSFFHVLQAGPSFPWPEVALATTYLRNGTILIGIAFALLVGPAWSLLLRLRGDAG